MDEKLQYNWNTLAMRLGHLPREWPLSMVFMRPPTAISPPYHRPANPLRPNDGPFCLDSSNPNNQEFLEVQMSVSRNIELCQTVKTENAHKILTDLRGVEDELEKIKQARWDGGRRIHYHYDNQVHPLEGLQPPGALMVFTPLYLQTQGLPRRLITFLLQFLVLLVTLIVEMSREDQLKLAEEVSRLPRSTTRLYNALKMDSPYSAYVCCHWCFAIYDAETWCPIKPPVDLTSRGRIPPPVYPVETEDRAWVHLWYTRVQQNLQKKSSKSDNSSWTAATSGYCTHRSTPDAEACGAHLVLSTPGKATGIFDGLYELTYQKYAETKLKPYCTFYVANLSHWISELIARKGMLDILRTVNVPLDTGPIQDIMQGSAIRNLLGPDGQPFIGPQVEGVHLCFALFMDFFNSEGNFIGGKHKSTGGIFLVILNLPVHLRYAPENMFPVFTPGGREPTTEELNHLLRPLVDQLIKIYVDGILLRMQRIDHVLDMVVRGMVAIIIADTPAAKKIGGFASHAHRWFCHICRLQREDIEANLDPETWPRMSQEDHDTLTKAWRDAPTLKMREELFQMYGIRYSELHRLPYLSLTQCIGAEPMHAIMLNTIQHHIRKTFGINAVQGDKFYDDNDEEGEAVEPSNTADSDSPELQKGLQIVNRPGVDTRAFETLSTMRVATLVALCQRIGVPTWHLQQHNGQPRRMEMVNSLAAKKKMAELRSQPDFSQVDSQEARDILSSSQDALTKSNILRDLSPEVLYETCSLAGINTASFPVQRNTIFPTVGSMVPALLSHSEGFEKRIQTIDVIHLWKSQRDPLIASTGESAKALPVERAQSLPFFNENFLREIWRDIDKTEFPEELAGDRPPKQLGTKQHGRLKASQWRTVCCFTMLITLGRVWGANISANNQETAWLTNYLHLVALVRIAYSYSITGADIQAFRQHSVAYLQGLRTYHPSSIKPSHHLLLHIPEFMERFGPIRGWWAFPFERFNGQVQHLNKNHKPGEVEKHFLTQWLHSSQVRVTLTNGSIPALQPLAALIHRERPSQIPLGGYANGARFGVDITATQLVATRLSPQTREALQKNGITHPHAHVIVLQKVTVEQRVFECYLKSNSNGLVEYSDPEARGWSTGYIHEMFRYELESGAETTMACIAKCKNSNGQFLQNNKELGVRLCGRDISCYVLVAVKDLYHIVRYPWDKQSQLIISIRNLGDASNYGKASLDLELDAEDDHQ